ncbi:MAG: glycosyltransferase family 2 protein [Fibrobacteres bacterium]|nr:glycosyltransferase family 2 protein [Fibrobacterota bacterium]
MDHRHVLSLLLPTFNRPATLRALLASLAQELDRTKLADRIEILVGDNGSGPKTTVVLEEFQGRLPMQVRRWEENRGAVANHQDLIERASGEVMAWISDDCRVLPGGLRRLVENIQAHPECSAFLSAEASIDSGKVGLKSLSDWDQVLLPSPRAAIASAGVLYWAGAKFFRRDHFPAELCAELNNKGPHSSGIVVLVQNVLLEHPVHYAADPYFVLENLSDWSHLAPTVDARYYKACQEYFRTLEDATPGGLPPELREHWAEPAKRLEHFLYYANRIGTGPVNHEQDRIPLLYGLLAREIGERQVGISDAALDHFLASLADAIPA